MNVPVVICVYCAVFLWSVEGNRVVKKEGEKVILSCELNVDFEVMWFALRPDNSLSLVMLTNVLRDGKSLTPTPQFDSRMVPVYHSNNMKLEIKNFTSTDVGLYYCAKREGNMFQIGNISEVALSIVSDKQNSGLVIGMELPGFIALLVAPPLSVLLSAVLIAFCPCYHKEIKRPRPQRK